MRKLLLATVLGVFLGAVGVALAQTYQQIPWLRVLNDAEVLGDLDVTGALTVGSCAGCGGGTPGGADTQVQYNDGGAFGGDSGLTFNETTNTTTTGTLIGTSNDSRVGNGTQGEYSITPQFGLATSGANALYGARDETNNIEGIFGPDTVRVVAGSSTAHAFQLRTANTKRIEIASDGSLIELDATAVDSNGVDMTPSSGTFTITYVDACTVSNTQSARWYKIGTIVTITVSAAMTTCTGDTTLFQTNSGDVPAAIRPSTSNVWSSQIEGNNNGTSTKATVKIQTDGRVVLGRCGTVTGTCEGGTWTNAGNRAIDAWTITYVR